jgi:hypothetical protein
LADLLANVNTANLGEGVPATTRSLNFRVTVRDGRGGINSDDVVVNVVNTGAPFAVTAPNSAVNWTGGATQSVTWNVAGTQASGINAANVHIRLSTDGGLSFPFLLATTANDGSETITVPNINTNLARIKVEAAGNIFFDVSNTNFNITANPTQPGFGFVESGASTQVFEGGPTDSYSIAPFTPPAGTVTVAVTSGPQTLISSDGINFAPALDLVFTTAAAQTTHVRAINDSLNDGSQTSLIAHAVVASTSATYPVGTLINSVTSRVIDNELPPVVGVEFDIPGQPKPTNWTQRDFSATTALPRLST